MGPLLGRDAEEPGVEARREVGDSERAIQKELFNVDRFFDLTETRNRLAAWVDFYNFRRTHHAPGGLLVPADHYQGRADRVLAAIEAGRSADGSGKPVAVAADLVDLLAWRPGRRGGRLPCWPMRSVSWHA